MKRLFSLLLVSVMTFSLVCTVRAASPEAIAAADAIHELGLFQGVGINQDGTPNYDLDRAPNRFEAVTMLVRLLGKEEEAAAGTWNTPFTDVAEWAIPYVGYAYSNKLTDGISDASFGGASPVTAAQYITFVLRALGYDSSSDFQWDAAWELSDELGVTSGQYDASSSFTRGDVAIISNSALSANLKGKENTLLQSLQLDEVIPSPQNDPIENNHDDSSSADDNNKDYKAWFSIDEQGGLLVQSDIDASNWDGYAVLMRASYGDKEYDHDWEWSTQKSVEVDASYLLAPQEDAAVLQSLELYVFPLSGESISDLSKSFNNLSSEFFDTMEINQYSFEKAINSISHKTAARVLLDKTVTVSTSEDLLPISSIDIINDADGKETYSVEIGQPVEPEGVYSLLYRSGENNHRFRLSALHRDSDRLTFTRETGHFSELSISGSFYVIYCTFDVDSSGNATCTKSVSDGYEYSFQ